MDDNPRIGSLVMAIDSWLDTMRGERGYTGPVAHRWQDCLIYAGQSSDWRYEGIISGYLNLYESSSEDRWLAKARRAGQDILNSQVQSGNYYPSSFEANPSPGGNPHEAACDLALLRLAMALKERAAPGSEAFTAAAERNLRGYYLGQLWDAHISSFHNIPGDPSIVPNKVATAVEALLVLAGLRQDGALVEQFIEPALESILACQVSVAGSPFLGAIDQSVTSGRPSGRYFPLYIARCLPALLAAHRLTARQRYLDAAISAMGFIMRYQGDDGSFPQLVYANKRTTIYPQWIAGCGAILRAAYLLEPYGFAAPALELTELWLLKGMMPSGGVRTGRGFARLEGQPRSASLADFRDLLPACGWVDKAFHSLCLKLAPGWEPRSIDLKEVELECLYRGQRALYHETREVIEVLKGAETLYHWRKGDPWASIL